MKEKHTITGSDSCTNRDSPVITGAGTGFILKKWVFPVLKMNIPFVNLKRMHDAIREEIDRAITPEEVEYV